MDCREEMTLSGSSQYYFNTGVSGPIPNSSSSVFGSSPPDFENFSNPNSSVETNVIVGHVGPTLKVENSPSSFGDEMNMGVNSGGGGVNSGDLAKKKRGRPRKYGPDGANVSLALSPLSSNLSPGSEVERKNRGRPKGTGRKQRLASLGEWMNSSAGMAFTPHVIHIGVGEDIASKILLFAQQRPRALCIMSAHGTVSAVTLTQPESSQDSVTYEGRFQILCLSGSYLLSEEGGPRDRTGGLSISVCSPDGHVIGGAVGGRLIAASLVQVIVCSFVYGDSKTKNSPNGEAKADHDSEVQPTEKSSTPGSAGPSEDIAPNSAMAGSDDIAPNSTMVGSPPNSWPGTTEPKTEIDLAHG